MRVQVELQAYLDKYSPNGAGQFELELPEGATVDTLVRRLGIPDDMAQVIIVNNENSDFDRPLQEGDRVILIPPLAGGAP
jgi:molybdopterin converting factor small subunit